MSDQADIKSDEIEEFLNESFMVVDELEDNYKSKTVEDIENGLSDIRDSSNLTTEAIIGDEDITEEKQSQVTEVEDACPQQSEEIEHKDGEELEHEDVEEGHPEDDNEVEETASGGTHNLDSKQDEEAEDSKTEEVFGQEAEEAEEEETIDTHPYLYLIESFELTKEQKTVTDVGPPKPIKETPLHMVNSRGQLLGLLHTLRSAKEIAVNFHADYKSFTATLCMLEISTRDSDYIIDGLKLRSDLLLLTEIFINPKIVKIMYKADQVLYFLQYFLHLFVVNVFDIATVGKALNNGKFMQMHLLLKNEYSFDTNSKVQQTADFRARPISEDLKTHCRGFPHHMIHLYHSFKNRLLEDEKLYQDVMQQCRNMCKVLYPHVKGTQLPVFEAALKKRHDCQLEILRNLYEWRESVAQKKNKNPDIIVTKNGLLNLASNMPIDEAAVCESSDSVYVKNDVAKIIAIVLELRQKHNIQIKLKKRERERLRPKKIPLPLRKGLKRQLNDHKSETSPSKHKRTETTFSKTKNQSPPNKQKVYEKDKSKTNGSSMSKTNRKAELPPKPAQVSRNRREVKPTTKPSIFVPPPLVQNLNTPAPAGTFLKQSAPQPFLSSSFNLSTSLNDSNTAKRTNKPRRSRFEPVFDATIPAAMVLKPTNVPSITRFQTNLNFGATANVPSNARFQPNSSFGGTSNVPSNSRFQPNSSFGGTSNVPSNSRFQPSSNFGGTSNVPSNMRFQPNSNFGGKSNVDSNTRFQPNSNFGGTSFQEYTSPLGNFTSGKRDDGLNRYSQGNSMTKMQQGAGFNRFDQVFEDIDYKINTLERKVSNFQDPNDMESNMYKRRYN